jgi:flavin reductase (DIM6/NTAB) family NADH-FMN oxidoreductase RutF
MNMNEPTDEDSPTEGIDGLLMRQVMSRFATGVAVVATTSNRTHYAAAVNSLTSVSLKPPLLLMCFRKTSRTCTAIDQAGRFSISVLDSRQEEQSRRFARAAREPLSDDDLAFHKGMPVVPGALATLVCRHEASHNVGDHTVVIGRVVFAEHRDGEPLLFFSSRYHALSAPDLDVEWRW